MKKQVELITLGRFALSSDNNRLDIGIKPALLITYIASRDTRRVSRQDLLDLLWPNIHVKQARHSLSQALHSIRSRLGASSIKADTHTIELVIPVRWDYAVVLTSLATKPFPLAIEEIGGSFLPDIFVEFGNDLEDWRQEHVTRLLTTVHSAYAEWRRVASVQGDTPSLQRCRQLFQEKFGIDLLDAEENDATARGHYISAPADSLNPFIGRSEEIRRLLAAWQHANGGHPSHVFLVGEAGVGKTRLASAVMTAVERSHRATCLTARCYQGDQSSGLAPILAALRPHQDALSSVSAPWRSAITTGLAGGTGWTNNDYQNFLIEGVIRWIESISTRSVVVLFVDDVQWASPTTMQFLQALVNGRRGVRFLLLIAGRAISLQEHGRRSISSIRLGGLSIEDIELAALSYAIPVHESKEIASALYCATDGHPYLVHDVFRTIANSDDRSAKAFKQATRASVTDSITRQLTATSAHARHLLNVISVFGKPTRFKIAKRAAGLSVKTFSIAVSELLESNLIVDKNGWIEVRHDLIRETVESGLSTSQRKVINAECAAVLRKKSASPVDLVPHYVRAGNRKQTYISALCAARLTTAGAGGAEQEMFLKVAAKAAQSVPKRCVILWRRLVSAVNRNQCSSAIKLCDEIERLGIGLSPLRRATLDYHRLDAEYRSGIGTLMDITKRAEAHARQTENSGFFEIHTQFLWIIVRIAIEANNRARLQTMNAHLSRMLAGSGSTSATVDGYILLAYSHLYLGQFSDARVALVHALDLARSLEKQHPASLARALGAQAMGLGYFGEVNAADRCVQEALRLCERLGLFKFRSTTLGNAFTIAMDRADFIAAEIYISEQIKLAESHQSLIDVSLAYGNYSLLCLEQKKYEAAIDYAERTLTTLESGENRLVDAMCRAIIGYASLELGRVAEARNRVRELTDRDGMYGGNDILTIEQFLVRWHTRFGDPRHCVTRLERILAHVDSEMSEPCRRGLELELARVLIRSNPERARNLAQNVVEWSAPRGAVLLQQDAERFLNRLDHLTEKLPAN